MIYVAAVEDTQVRRMPRAAKPPKPTPAELDLLRAREHGRKVDF